MQSVSTGQFMARYSTLQSDRGSSQKNCEKNGESKSKPKIQSHIWKIQGATYVTKSSRGRIPRQARKAAGQPPLPRCSSTKRDQGQNQHRFCAKSVVLNNSRASDVTQKVMTMPESNVNRKPSWQKNSMELRKSSNPPRTEEKSICNTM